MNLIEQLGGSEKAKAALTELHRAGKDLITCGKSVIVGRELEDALLDYRRANNIFEEDDLVIIPSRGNGVFRVSRLLSRNDIAEMRHTTDEEIKAGRRL